jgi:spore cortex biosynthesis protein YabQ
MKLVIINELRFFLNSILWGVILLVIYDVFRIIRKIIKHNAFFVAIQDIIYWIVCSILIFNMMYEQNNGIIRAFAVLAIVIGMLLYHGSVSDMVVDFISMVINKVIHFVNVVLGTVINTILWPFKFIFKKIRRFVLFILKKVRKLVLALIKPLKIKKKKVKMELSENQEDE